MNTTRISDNIHYIGVNDRTTARFEGLWPLPLGVSYNSYLVTGPEKTAIIDGVEMSHALEQVGHIREILGDRQPDYLVINHMEPDHSGSIDILRREFPDITVVGNALTLGYIRGFYGEGARTRQIKEGDILDLGGDVNLRFAMIPMVHWPETMVTYLPARRTLFTGDAFGCFGALNGAVLDTEMDTERYFPEMVRYYSNIVGKYGAFVQKALGKLRSLEIETVCPTHGPVWREQKDRVIDLYDRLSRYEPLDNGVTIVYGSMYGNTQRMAEAAAEALAQGGVREISVINASCTDLSHTISEIFAHRGLVVAAPTYSDTLFPPVAAVLDALVTRGVKNRDCVAIGGHTWSQRAIGEISARLEACGLNIVAEPVGFKQAPDAGALDRCRAAASALAALLTAAQ